MDSQEKIVKDIVKAWTVPGPYPAYHNQMRAQLFNTWPTLAKAIERLVEKNG